MNLDGTRVCVGGPGRDRGRPRPGRLAARGADGSWRSTAATASGERALAAELRGLGVEVRARRRPTSCPTASSWSSPHRAGGRTSRCSRPPRRAACRSGARSSWPGGCARRAQPWLGVTGTNGKTTTVLMLAAILGAAGHRAVAAGQRRPAGAGRRARRPAVRRAGRRAVELPAALDLDGRPARRRPCSTSRRTTSTGTARWRSTPPTRRCVWRGGAVRGRTTPTTRAVVELAAADADGRDGRVHPRRAGPASSAAATAPCSSACGPA